MTLDRGMKFTIATCNYAAFKPEMGFPIRTSVGYPRFWRGDKLAAAPSMYPVKIFRDGALCADREAFKRAYFDILDRNAVKVVMELQQFALDHPGVPLVLLCYENIARGEWCHRTMLAEWLEANFALAGEIPELGPGGDKPKPQGEQLDLLACMEDHD